MHTLENYTFKKEHLNSSEKSNFKCHSPLVNNPNTSQVSSVEIL